MEAGLEDLLGNDSSSSSASKREFEELLAAREPISVGTLGSSLGKGLLTGGAFAGLEAGLEDLLGGDSSSSSASKRQLEELLARGGAGSILGKIVGATEQDIGDVIKNGAIGGVAAGTSSGITNGILRNNKRELEARQGIAGAAEKVVADTLGDTIK